MQIMDVIYTAVTLLIGVGGIWAFLGLVNTYIPRKPQRGSTPNDDPFHSAGMIVTLKQYNIIRYVIYAILAGTMFYQTATTKTISILAVVLLLAIVAITTPTMPFISVVPKLLQFAASTRRKRLNQELLTAFMHLKNLALVETGLNAYEVLRKLMRQSKDLKPALSDVIKAWHNPVAREDAIEAFTKTIGTEDAKNFGSILLKMDTTPMGELTVQLNNHEQRILERRQTNRENTSGALNELFFALVTALLMTVLANFIFVAVFSQLAQSLRFN